MSLYPVIAIDGPAASGKSTIARLLAQRLGLTYVNTGAMYRAVTWKLMSEGVTLEPEPIASRIKGMKVECGLEQGALVMKLDGVDPLPHVRDGSVNASVSLVASVPEVRAVLVARQRELADLGPVVMEGRDMASVVFPNTPHKFYIDADEAVREARRMAQGEVDTIAKRDKMDSSRKASPLTLAPGAVRIDTTHLNVEQTLAAVMNHLEHKGIAVA